MCSQLCDGCHYWCFLSLFLCAGIPEHGFQICDWRMIDLLAFLRAPMTCGFVVVVVAAAVAAAE